ncbi:MAG TPA: hypothetical protein VEB21_13615, partial [Terriglobales bacterium]|nr:hypothetical protein [Terriglobales bacterium]
AMITLGFSDRAWVDPEIKLYRDCLTDLPYGATKAAVMSLLLTRTSRERPLIAEIREAVRKQLDAAGAIPHEPDEDEAWGYVMRQFGETGSYRPFPTDRYPEVAAIVNRIGWEALCRSDNAAADRAHFLQLYRLEKGRRREARNSARSLSLPSDAAHLEAQGGKRVIDYRPAILSLPAPTADERAAGAGHIREILLSLSGRPSPHPVSSPPPRSEPIAFAKPTPEEIVAADARKAHLRAQAVEIHATEDGEQLKAG